MGRRSAIGRSAIAAALLAVALLSLAAVRSVVMQAEMAVPGASSVMAMAMPICGDGASHHAANKHGEQDKSGKTCEFCAAAAHAAVCASAPDIAPPVALAWTVYPALQPLGPRGPPEFTARSRGPPSPILAI